MLVGMGAAGQMGGINQGSSMREVINALGLTTNLKLLLDAGDLASVASGTQDKWTDLSGGGYDFYRGTGTGSDAADPTFNGTVGGQSSGEYWSFDGGDYFTYDSVSEAWMNNLHKDGARFTVAMWVQLPASGGQIFLVSSYQATVAGITLKSSLASNHIEFRVGNGGDAFLATKTGTAHTGAWVFVGLSVDESGNSCLWNVNGSTQADACTYLSPSTGAADIPMTLLSSGAADKRAASLAMWEGTALSAANLAALFAATRGKFGV